MASFFQGAFAQVQGAFQNLASALTGNSSSQFLQFRHDLSEHYSPTVSWQVLETEVMRRLPPHPALALASTCTRLYRTFHLSVTEMPGYVQTTITDDHLQLFPNVERLDLSRTIYFDAVSPQILAKLRFLHTFTLHPDLEITDEELSHLTSLTSLNLAKCRSIRGTGLASLPHLTSLSGLGRSFDGLNLNVMTQLRSLSLRGNLKIGSAFIKTLTALTSLDISSSAVDPSFLPSLPHLQSLASNGISDKVLQELTALTSLDIDENEHVTEAGLSHLTSLTSLSLRGAAISSLPLNLTKLVVLKLSHPLNNFEEVQLPFVTSLALPTSLLSSLGDRISFFPALTDLTLTSSSFHKVSFDLPQFSQLKRLSLVSSSNDLSASAFVSLGNLNHLRMQGVQLNSSELEFLTSLTSLDLGRDQTLSESTIFALPALQVLTIEDGVEFDDDFRRNFIKRGGDIHVVDNLLDQV